MSDPPFEDRLAAMLEGRAADAEPRPDLNAVLDNVPGLESRRTEPPRHLARALVAAAAIALLAVGISAAVLSGRSKTTVRTATAHQHTTTCLVYLVPSVTPNDAMAVGEVLRARANTLHLRYIDQADSYERFKTMFADDPSILAAVSPADLPPAWTFGTTQRAEDARVAIQASVTGPNIYQVDCGNDTGFMPLPTTTVAHP